MVTLIIFLISILAIQLAVHADGNVTCSGTGMDWYTNFVGESPCKTYERLRQICNPAFEVGVMRTSTPPDVCDEQLADCCCNSIAFALSMLCLNCQQNIGTGTGYDAGDGAYELYLQGDRVTGFCAPVNNQTLSPSVHSAVCNEEIKIFDTLFTLFWGPGAWFYEYTKQATSEYIASTNNNTFTGCPSTTLNQTTPALSSIAASKSSTTSLVTSLHLNPVSLSGGIIGGIIVGVVAVVTTATFLGRFLWRKWNKGLGNRPGWHHIEPFTLDIPENTQGQLATYTTTPTTSVTPLALPPPPPYEHRYLQL
ncbi:hypothetical protein BDP27DRAFT_1422661 [Rhodocollybia butyracea]|uniref:Uncharacterized protein n=1 Tax=Rhodocollybia butyracea TaxID=206335 RepID=A0A9P5PQK1_9AGAR|nr:hypothetical protein BDP27DRAFT_1422661 [Rhodocollybia butyracea]